MSNLQNTYHIQSIATIGPSNLLAIQPAIAAKDIVRPIQRRHMDEALIALPSRIRQ